MRRVTLLLLLVLLAGCMRLVPPDTEAYVEMLTTAGVIYAPKVNDMPCGYEGCYQPGKKLVLDFNPGRDQLGNRTGLSSSRYVIDELVIRCELKNNDDTIFFVFDSYMNAADNVFVWFPLYTAGVDLISGLPYPWYPLAGYPWDSCMTHDLGEYPGQTATIHVTARANWVRVAFVCPEGAQWYQLENSVPQDSNEIEYVITQGGEYFCSDSDGNVYEFDVPEDWFWIRGTFEVNVCPTGVCS